MDLNTIRERLEQERKDRARLFSELENVRARAQADGDSAGLTERTANLNRGVEAADARIADMEAEYGRTAERTAYLERQGGDRRNVEGEVPATDRTAARKPQNENREQALRTIERHRDSFDDGAASRTERLVRQESWLNDWVSRYLAAVGDPAYAGAFAKIMGDPTLGHLRMNAEEVEAVRAVSAVQQERALAVGAGATGGFAIPIQIDPTIVLTSAGALNPVRQLARVETMISNELRLVTSAGVTSQYRAEAATMTDNSPTLAQPVITARRWDSFVPYSWETTGDWPSGGLENELVRLIADAQNINDASVFFSGTSSSNQPNGLMSSLGTSQQIQTAGTATLAAGDVWALKAAVPTRFQPTTTIAAPPAMVDKFYRLVPNASTVEPQIMASRDSALVGRQVAEWTFNAGTSIASGGTLAIAGDFKQYVIGDRLGLTAIPIPALFSGNTAGGFGYPTGQAGLVVWGRTGAVCANPDAFRVLTSR